MPRHRSKFEERMHLDDEVSPFELLSTLGNEENSRNAEENSRNAAEELGKDIPAEIPEKVPLELSNDVPLEQSKDVPLDESSKDVSVKEEVIMPEIKTEDVVKEEKMEFQEVLVPAPEPLALAPRPVVNSEALDDAVSLPLEQPLFTAEQPPEFTQIGDVCVPILQKISIPGRYRLLLHGAQTFPTLRQDILSLIEELIHYHNCTCLLRTDLNHFRCRDCGKGFLTYAKLRNHGRNCLIQKLEKNMFASCLPDIVNQGPARPKSKKTVHSGNNAQSKRPSTPSDTGNGVESEPSTPASNSSSKAGKVRPTKEFIVGTSWNNTKVSAERVTKVEEQNQFSQKRIIPYNLYRHSGEIFFHNPIPTPLNFTPKAQNVFNMMISELRSAGAITHSRRLYVQTLLQCNRRPALTPPSTPPSTTSTESEAPREPSAATPDSNIETIARRVKRKLKCYEPSATTSPQRKIISPLEPVLNETSSTKPASFDVDKRVGKIKLNSKKKLTVPTRNKPESYTFHAPKDIIQRVNDLCMSTDVGSLKLTAEQVDFLSLANFQCPANVELDSKQLAVAESLIFEMENQSLQRELEVYKRLDSAFRIVLGQCPEQKRMRLTEDDISFMRKFLTIGTEKKEPFLERALDLERCYHTAAIRETLSSILEIPAYRKSIASDFSTKVFLDNFVTKELPFTASDRDFEIAQEIFDQWLPPGHAYRQLPRIYLGERNGSSANGVEVVGVLTESTGPQLQRQETVEQPAKKTKISTRLTSNSDCEYAGEDCSCDRSVRFLASGELPLVRFCRKHFEKIVLDIWDGNASHHDVHITDNLMVERLVKKFDEESKQSSAVRERLIDENFNHFAKIKKLKAHKDKHDNELQELKVQITEEQNLRKFFKAELDKALEANKQLSVQLKKMEGAVEKAAKKRQSMCSCTDLKLDLKEKAEENRQQDITIKSLSEALRKQSKTISTITRKTSSSEATAARAAESLITTTCIVLSERQQQEGTQITEPTRMREVCESVSGPDNLFALLTGMFRSEGQGEDQTGSEKRALFLINLMAYFFGGGEAVPSSSELSEVL